MATQIRKTTTTAVEDTLRELGCLPLEHALEVLGHKNGEYDIADVASVFASSLIAALQQGAKGGEAGASPGEDVAIESIISRIRGEIEADSEILKILKQVMAPKGKGRLDKAHREAIQRFVSFQMYSRSTDKFVRQGDIARVVRRDNGQPVDTALFLILNAACDLERFPSKTREVLTVLSLHPLKADPGLQFIGRGGNEFHKMGASVFRYENKKGSTAGGTIFLPNIPEAAAGGGINFIDYVGIAQETSSIRIAPCPAGTKRLTYPTIVIDSDKTLQRICSVNFGFLPAILGAIAGGIAGYGVPDIPNSERDRISELGKKDAH